MPSSRFPLRDPRTVARDIPGVLDVLFPHLNGGLVNVLNSKLETFDDIEAIPIEAIEACSLQHAMLFELAMARAESELGDSHLASWAECLEVAARRQRRHFDARIPENLLPSDISVAEHAARNLVAMINCVKAGCPSTELELAPRIPGLGWVASGNGDFALGPTLIEVKHTQRNFSASDFRQVLMYWLLKYACAVEADEQVWSDVLLLNPRRNTALQIEFDHLLQLASTSLNRVELVELLRSIVAQDIDRR